MFKAFLSPTMPTLLAECSADYCVSEHKLFSTPLCIIYGHQIYDRRDAVTNLRQRWLSNYLFKRVITWHAVTLAGTLSSPITLASDEFLFPDKTRLRREPPKNLPIFYAAARRSSVIRSAPSRERLAARSRGQNCRCRQGSRLPYFYHSFTGL